jgi:hypothetical protein
MKKIEDATAEALNEESERPRPSGYSRRRFVLGGAAAASALSLAQGLCLAQHDPRELPEVETHPAVEGETLSQEYTLNVNGQEVPVYTASLMPEHLNKFPQPLDPTYSFASFEFSGKVTVKVTSAKALTAFSLRPHSPFVRAHIQGNAAVFVLKRPGNFVIERNGNGRKDPLLLFANPVETARPGPDESGVIYYGPGRHNAGTIHLISNQTLYIAGGAVVTGAVIAHGDNIQVIGRGLLENSGPDYAGKYMILLEQCTRVRLEGIMIRKNSRGWTIAAKDCDGVSVANVKLCGGFSANDDGIDPVNTRNMTIMDCFVRTNDDCLAFKGMGYENHNCENILVTRTSLWSDSCCAILLGDESRAAFMRNIVIKDCHVLYLSYEAYPKKFLMMHSCEEMRMEDIRFENIDIFGEGQDRNFIEMACEFNKYNKTQVPGSIRNIVLKNVGLVGKDGSYSIVIRGFSDQYGIDGVRFEHCTISGHPITERSPNVHIGQFARNVRFSK